MPDYVFGENEIRRIAAAVRAYEKGQLTTGKDPRNRKPTNDPPNLYVRAADAIDNGNRGTATILVGSGTSPATWTDTTQPVSICNRTGRTIEAYEYCLADYETQSDFYVVWSDTAEQLTQQQQATEINWQATATSPLYADPMGSGYGTHVIDFDDILQTRNGWTLSNGELTVPDPGLYMVAYKVIVVPGDPPNANDVVVHLQKYNDPDWDDVDQFSTQALITYDQSLAMTGLVAVEADDVYRVAIVNQSGYGDIGYDGTNIYGQGPLWSWHRVGDVIGPGS